MEFYAKPQEGDRKEHIIQRGMNKGKKVWQTYMEGRWVTDGMKPQRQAQPISILEEMNKEEHQERKNEENKNEKPKEENRIKRLREEMEVIVTNIATRLDSLKNPSGDEVMEIYEVLDMIGKSIEALKGDKMFVEEMARRDKGYRCVKRKFNDRCKDCDKGEVECPDCTHCIEVREIVGKNGKELLRKKLFVAQKRIEYGETNPTPTPNVTTAITAETNRNGNYKDKFLAVTYTLADTDVVLDRSNIKMLERTLIDNFMKLGNINEIECKGWLYAIEMTKSGTPHLHGIMRLDVSKLPEKSISAKNKRFMGKNQVPWKKGSEAKRIERLDMLKKQSDLNNFVNYILKEMVNRGDIVRGGDPLAGTGVPYPETQVQ